MRVIKELESKDADSNWNRLDNLKQPMNIDIGKRDSK